MTNDEFLKRQADQLSVLPPEFTEGLAYDKKPDEEWAAHMTLLTQKYWVKKLQKAIASYTTGLRTIYILMKCATEDSPKSFRGAFATKEAAQLHIREFEAQYYVLSDLDETDFDIIETNVEE